MLRITSILTAVALAVLFAFNACESGNKDDASDPDDNNTQQTAQSLIQDGKGNITVTLHEHLDQPATKKGTEVTLTVTCGKDSDGKSRNKEFEGELDADGEKEFDVDLNGEGWGDSVDWANCVFKATALVDGKTIEAKVEGFNTLSDDGTPPVFVAADILAASSAGKPFDINGVVSDSHYAIKVTEACDLQVLHFDGAVIKKFKGNEDLVLTSDNNGNITGFFALGNPKADCELALKVGDWKDSVAADSTVAPQRKDTDDANELHVFEIANYTEVVHDVSTDKDVMAINTAGTQDTAPAVLKGRVQPYFSNDNGETWVKQPEVEVAKWKDLGNVSALTFAKSDSKRSHHQALLKVKATYDGSDSEWWVYLGNSYRGTHDFYTTATVSKLFRIDSSFAVDKKTTARVVESCNTRVFYFKEQFAEKEYGHLGGEGTADAPKKLTMHLKIGKIVELGRAATEIELQEGYHGMRYLRGFTVGDFHRADQHGTPRCGIVLKIEQEGKIDGIFVQIQTNQRAAPTMTLSNSSGKIAIAFAGTPDYLHSKMEMYVSNNGGATWEQHPKPPQDPPPAGHGKMDWPADKATVTTEVVWNDDAKQNLVMIKTGAHIDSNDNFWGASVGLC